MWSAGMKYLRATRFHHSCIFTYFPVGWEKQSSQAERCFSHFLLIFSLSLYRDCLCLWITPSSSICATTVQTSFCKNTNLDLLSLHAHPSTLPHLSLCSVWLQSISVFMSHNTSLKTPCDLAKASTGFTVHIDVEWGVGFDMWSLKRDVRFYRFM